MTIDEFIETCKTEPALPYDKYKDTVQLESLPSGVLKAVSEAPFHEDLKASLQPDEGEIPMSSHELSKLVKGLINELIVNKKSDAQYSIDLLIILKGIIGASVTSYCNLDNPKWKHIISLLKGYLEKDDTLVTADNLFPNKYKDRATTALSLKAYGVEVSVENGELIFTNLEKAFKEVDRLVGLMGGRFFIEQILKSLEYSKDFGRYIIPKQTHGTSVLEAPAKSVPFNYMLNIGLKKLGSEGLPQHQNKEFFHDIVQLFSNICFAIMEVQTYSMWENMFHQDKSIMNYICDLVFRESIFGLQQSSIRFVSSLLKFLKSNLKEENYNVNDLCSFLHFIMGKSHPDLFVEINRKEFNRLRLDNTDIRSLLKEASLPIDEINSKYLDPTDYANVNYWFTPLIQKDPDTYLILPAPMVSRCCLEAALSWVRLQNQKKEESNNKESKANAADAWFGHYLEDYLYYLFSKAGIVVKHGEYDFEWSPSSKDDNLKEDKKIKIEGECDGLIELEKKFILMEVKKKSLIRKSRSGSDFDILMDLNGTLLASQVQGLRTQLALKKNQLKLGVEDDAIHPEGKAVERFTVTLLPFGDLQDKMIINEILKIFLSSNFEYRVDDESSLDKEQKKDLKNKRKKLSDLSKKQEELRFYVEAIGEENIFRSSWFLDAEKILYLLKDGKEEFVKTMNKLSHLTTGSLDFYNELLFLKQMDSAKSSEGH